MKSRWATVGLGGGLPRLTALVVTVDAGRGHNSQIPTEQVEKCPSVTFPEGVLWIHNFIAKLHGPLFLQSFWKS